ncbi:MAG: metallophosphoesterase [Proteobacteria bacterium]|nr:metallophosphoesterase [Pseudomonadota bacterium]
MTVFAAPARLPAGMRVYAIGDIHGCDRELAALHAAIEADLARRPVRAAAVVHLGDYFDHGPDSAAVLARLVGLSAIAGARVVNLLGDHEKMMLDALAGDRAAATDWLHSGGAAALASFGLAQDAPRETWAAALPAALPGFLRSLAPSHRAGGYVFAHAGVRPGVPLDRQAADDLTGIRQPFLSAEQDFGAVVVHGHTPVSVPAVRPNRIALDTGAGLGGKLTCAVLEADEVGFFWA